MDLRVAEMQAKQEALMSQNSETESLDGEGDKAEMERLIKILKLRIDILQHLI